MRLNRTPELQLGYTSGWGAVYTPAGVQLNDNNIVPIKGGN